MRRSKSNPSEQNLSIEGPLAVCGIHWQVAQGTSLENIDFYMAKGTTQQGIYMENGSGGYLADLTFVGGHFGAYLGNQQFTSSHLVFVDCDVAMQIHWDWAWTMQDIIIESCDAGIIMVGGAGGAFSTGQSVGSLVLADVIIANTPTGIITSLYGENSTSLMLQNIGFFNVESAVVDNVKGTALLDGGDAIIKKSWGFGMFIDASGDSFFANGIDLPAMNRTGSLFTSPASDLLENYYYTRRRPSYTDIGLSQILDVKAYGAQSDGYADDTAALNSVLAIAANMSSIVYFPFGVYLIKDTLHVPVGSRIVGQAWAQIMATGPKFGDAHRPQVAIEIGQPGDVGSIEIQDMLFTVRGPTAGVILVEWNVHQNEQGSAGLWDSHVRVGGAIGSLLQKADCPKQTGHINPSCQAASLLVHLTPTSSAYLENVWAWVADHDLDVESQDQIDIYSGRGILVESQGPVWLYGTASEHSAMYQYQFSNAQDVLMGMIQTESPYYQASPKAPEPFGAGVFSSDPTFADCAYDSKTCAVSWAVRIVDSSHNYMLGAGLYSWFSDYSQKCLDTDNCQDRGLQIEESYDIWLFNVVTKAILEMISPTNSKPIFAKDNKNGYCSSVLAWFRGANNYTGQRTFSGFNVYEQSWVEGLNLPNTCKTALTQKILCDEIVEGFSEPSYRGSIDNSTLYQEVCDASCGSSLRSYYENVSRACDGYSVTSAPPTKVGGYLWEGWNGTCYVQPGSDRYCNEVIDEFTEVDTIDDMPLDEMCSYCFTKKYEMMQGSPYSAYDIRYQSDLETINAKCGLEIPTTIPPPLVAAKVEADRFCVSDVYHTTREGDTCATIAKTYSVVSAAVFSGNSHVMVNCTLFELGKELCIPLTCDVYELQEDDFCISIQAEQGIHGLASLRTYNPWINHDCSNLQSDREYSGGIVCISPQGGQSANISSVRDGNVVPPQAVVYIENAVLPPPGAKLATGTSTDCGKWHTVKEHETCAAICIREQINIDMLVVVNPSLGRDSCTEKLVTNTTICVGPTKKWGSGS